MENNLIKDSKSLETDLDRLALDISEKDRAISEMEE